ncbi:MAG: response regulator [Bacteroidales bacterium]|jgi:CheY-like chemotaxis protein|nr:response regulator [Bacteroidales bacterium]HOA08794.1 response regulator [Tenuifilaceae bacterium]MBP8642516.1 response regulator [Bacteroidales bacterium]NLI88562.1 response regulator [Bacteroidales bacterium]HOC36083.1 response regulator [Tenuifilaceae bacterium]
MPTPAKKTILIVDDDVDYLYQLKFQVEKMGFETVTAESQHEAETLLNTIKPDLAILDLMMESEDSGFILSYKLKRKYPDVPIIIATAVSAETGMTFGINTEEERKWIKADLYLEKGIRPDQLHREIVKLLKL